jgi:hypothetical protein
MSFCPSCGVQNTDDARFCNKCGTAITVGGSNAAGSSPASATASPTNTPPTNTGGTVTLAGIGIQSPSKTYAVLAVGALAFLGLGAGLAYFGMRSSGAPATASADTTGGAGTGTGDALPDGVDVPDDDFVMTSGAHVVKRGPSAPGGSTAPSEGTSGTPTSATHTVTPPAPTAGGTRPTHPPHGGTAAHPDPTTATGSGSGTGTTGTGTGTTGTGAGTGTGTGTGTASGTGTPPASAVDWDSMSDTIDPDSSPDYQMQMYSTQVRRFIRQYLLPRATSCFEHASAVQRDPVRGTVAIGFDIDARGHAQSASIDRNTTNIESLGTCLRNEVNGWQLPPPPEGTAPIQMQMPFTR